jgi:major membrane immunogen (membrane-anchored lipoprotein)
MRFLKTLTPLIALLVLSVSAWAQDKAASKPASADSLSGSYKGKGNSDATGEFPLTVDVKVANGKVTGTISSPQGDAAITDGTYTDGKITLKFDAAGNEGNVTAEYKDGKIVGTWTLAGINGTLDLSRAGAEPAATMAGPAASSSSSGAGAASSGAGGASAAMLTGEWDATASVGGMDYPFTLKLVVDGEKVTGNTTNQMGTVDIKTGSLSSGKITLAIETPQFTFTLTGTIKDGKLVGEITSDQFQGTWEAKKK